MKTKLASLAAAATALAPAAAWAHGDHEGLHGFVHELTSPGHLGLLLLGGLATIALGRQVAPILRRKAVRVRKDTH